MHRLTVTDSCSAVRFRSLVTGLCCLVVVLAPELASACCMVPVTYAGSIGQEAQEAVMLHADGREELVLRINYRITGKTMPDQFVWVITVPNEPDGYALADPALFKDMFQLSQRLLAPPPPRSKGRTLECDGAVPAGVELGERVKIGPYDIQPIRGVGKQALTGLNTWLGSHDFPTEDPDHMSYFVDRKFTFLCIRVTPPAGETAVGAGGAVKPLQLSFASQQPYYPLKFSSRQGIFDVNLHLLLAKPLDLKASRPALTRMNWANSEYKSNVKLAVETMPESLRKVVADAKRMPTRRSWHYSNLRTRDTNRKHPISGWKDDIFLTVK